MTKLLEFTVSLVLYTPVRTESYEQKGSQAIKKNPQRF